MCPGHLVLLFWCSRALYTWGQLARRGGSVCTGYVCMCPLMILFWYSRAMYTWLLISGGKGPCALVIGSYCFGVVGLCTLGVNLGGSSALGTSAFGNRYYSCVVVELCTLVVD